MEKKALAVVVLLGTCGIIYLSKQEDAVRRKSSISATKGSLGDLQKSLQEYFNKNKDYQKDCPPDLREYSSGNSLKAMDGWGKEFNYKRTTYNLLTEIDGRPTIVRNVPHYELSSSGPDGIPETSDDIDAWFIKDHEWGSTARLKAKFERDLVEAKKTPLEKVFEKGESLLDRLR